VALSFGGIILLFGSGILLLFQAQLTKGAEIGYHALKGATTPLVPYIERLLRFIFTPRAMRLDPSSSSGSNTGSFPLEAGEKSWWLEMLQEIAGYGLGGLAFLLLLMLVIYFGWQLILRLLTKSPGDRGKTHPFSRLLLWWEGLRSFLAVWVGRIRNIPGRKGAGRLYGALLGWGRRSGLACKPSETPLEYGLRLGERFPALGKDISLIVDLYNRETYGGRFPGEEPMAVARDAWKKLRSPRNWPLRSKSWFFST
jgi:hypothetical protein